MIDCSKYYDSKNILLTPNQRLARNLIAEELDNIYNNPNLISSYQAYSELGTNTDIINSFNITSINDFINSITNIILECGYIEKPYFLLNSWQRELLFKQVITNVKNKPINTDNTIDYNLENDDITDSNVIIANSLYKKAVQAWSIAKQWQLNWKDWDDYLQPESKLFGRWASQYQEVLEQRHYLDPDAKLDLIIDLLDNALNTTNQTHSLANLLCAQYSNIDLFGFDDFSPQLASLFESLRSCNINITNLDETKVTNNNKHNIKIFAADDIHQEYYAVANWAKQHYLNLNNNAQNTTQTISKIGIVVPGLATHRAKLIKTFEELIPDRQAWNISGGDNLSEVPIIKAALILLEIVIYQDVDYDNLKYLLKSNYYLKHKFIDTASNNSSVYGMKDNHKEADNEFHQLNSSIDILLNNLSNVGYKKFTLSELSNELEALNKKLIDKITYNLCKLNNLQLPSKWAVIFSDILLELGWPAGCEYTSNEHNLHDITVGGDGAPVSCSGLDNIAKTDLKYFQKHNINSLEYQAIGQFQDCLLQVEQLDTLYGSISASKILRDLKDLLQNTPFQIQTDKNTIDILGMLEGAGIKYDKLWLFNMTSDIWPEQPSPNPFIPAAIQKKYDLPHATAKRELDYAKKLTQRYLLSSDDITISYSKLEDDRENQLSYLFAARAQTEETIKIHDESKPIDINKLFKVNNFTDHNGPAITHSLIKAGIKALSLQALCPFRAFAETRLCANQNYKLDIGPAPWLRGQVIHRALELLFGQYNTKQKLANLKLAQELNNNIDLNSKTELHADLEQSIKSAPNQNYNKILKQYIKQALAPYESQYKKIFNAGISLIEKELIFNILDQWLELELQREDFSILELEQKYLVKLKNIEFNVRIDRIDCIDHIERIGSKEHCEFNDIAKSKKQAVIIDYKTSRQNINSLFSDNISDLQLPLYLHIENLNNKYNITAAIYAEVLDENSNFKGISSQDTGIDGCKTLSNWDNLTTQWHEIIEQLEQDYALGLATVTPINPKATCRQCHLSSFCRKDECIDY